MCGEQYVWGRGSDTDTDTDTRTSTRACEGREEAFECVDCEFGVGLVGLSEAGGEEGEVRGVEAEGGVLL